MRLNLTLEAYTMLLTSNIPDLPISLPRLHHAHFLCSQEEMIQLLTNAYFDETSWTRKLQTVTSAVSSRVRGYVSSTMQCPLSRPLPFEIGPCKRGAHSQCSWREQVPLLMIFSLWTQITVHALFRQTTLPCRALSFPLSWWRRMNLCFPFAPQSNCVLLRYCCSWCCGPPR